MAGQDRPDPWDRDWADGSARPGTASPVLGKHSEHSPTSVVSAMTRHDFEAWLDHHLDQAVLVEWRELEGGLIADATSTTGALRKDGDGEYHAGDAHIALDDFEAADFGGDGVIVE